MKIKQKAVGLLIVLICFISLSKPLFGQVTVSVKMDTSMLLIGDQTNVILEASFPEGASMTMPVFADTLIKKLEILSVSNIDTVVENQMVRINQKYTVTSFDSGWYVIPPQNFIFSLPKTNRVDTIKSMPIYFGVMTMPIDTANANAITDIKAPIDAPITFKEILPFLGIGLAVLLLAAALYLLYLKWSKKEPLFVKKEIPKEPAHLVAFRGLDAIRNEKLWQKGLTKEYHSQLTEVVRVYIEDRFGILAMESTSDEIIDAFRKNGTVEKELKDGLFDTLMLADFVKFAKAEPLANENEQSLNFAYQFVDKTKLVEILSEEGEVTNEKNE